MSAVDAAYVAGFLDGEGCVMAEWRPRHGGLVWRVTFTNTNAAVLGWIRGVLGAGCIKRLAHPRESHHKQGYHLQISRRDDILRVLTTLEPYLHIKCGQARLAISSVQSKLSRLPGHAVQAGDYVVYETIRALNRKGTV